MTTVLYAAKGTTLATSDLYTLNPATGAASSVGAIGYAVTGLANRDTTRLWAVTSNVSGSDPDSLISINKATGAGTLIGSLGLGVTAHYGVYDIAVMAGVLYGVYRESGGSTHVISINQTTGAATSLGTISNTNAAGITAVPGVTAYMYLVEFVDDTTEPLYKLTPVPVLTAQGIITGYDPGDWPVYALSADPGDGAAVYALIENDGGATPPTVNLALLDTTDLTAPTATLIGATAAGMDALAWYSDAPPTAPAAPTLDSATPAAGTVTLSWTPGADGGSAVTAAKVYRGASSGTETLHATLGAVTTYIDHPPPGTWFYKVTEVNVVGESPLSNELSAAPDTFTWTNAGPQLAVSVASGLNPGSFTLARTLGLGEARARFDPLVDDLSQQTQAFSVRLEQHGASAQTEIYSVDLDLRPQPSSLQGENS